MTFGDIEKILKQKLPSYFGEGEAKAIYHLIAEHYTGLPKSKQRTLLNQYIPEQQLTDILTTIDKLKAGMPVQYALGEAWFLNNRYVVNTSVLIPRPETEELVLWVVETIKKSGLPNPAIIDIGTGSGCIAISIANMVPNATLTAIDVSEEALSVAHTNAKKLSAMVQCLPINFLDEKTWSALGNFDFIVSNPPYIPELEKETIESHVKAWEPSMALFTPDSDPHIFYRKIIQFSKSHSNPNARIIVEGHQDYLEETRVIFEQAGYHTEMKKDIHGNQRMLMALFNNSLNTNDKSNPEMH